MEGRKFSSSRRVVIYVRDFLERYDADALRYFVAVAGPESTDTDFTWSEFLRRNNDELVAGWGNLVNRSISMAAKNFGGGPADGRADRGRPGPARLGPGGLRHGRAASSSGTGSRRPSPRRCGWWARRTSTSPTRRRGRSRTTRTRDWARSCTWRCRWSATATCCSRRSCRTRPRSIHELLGGTGVHAPMPEIREVDDLDGGPGYPIITGRLHGRGALGVGTAGGRAAAGPAEAGLQEARSVHCGGGAGPPGRLSAGPKRIIERADAVDALGW